MQNHNYDGTYILIVLGGLSVGPQRRGDLALEVMYRMFTHVGPVLVDNQPALLVAFAV